MKIFLKAIVSIIAILIISNSAYTQSKTYTSEKGFWVIVSDIHNKKNNTIQFYDNNSNLIYEEKITGISINIKRKKNLRILKDGLEKAIAYWAQNHEVIKNGEIVAVLIHKKQ